MRSSTSYSIAGTKFYRLSSRMILGTYGSNLQNIEKSVRKLYWSDQNKVLCQADQAGAEALIVAYLCKHGNFRELFLNKIKPHCFVALHVFRENWKQKIQSSGLDIKCDIDELCSLSIYQLRENSWWQEVDKLIRDSDNWDASERYYYISKQICHSSNYGIRAGMFCLNTLEKSRGKIVINKKDAEKFLEMYHGLFPEIREWHKETEEQVKRTRYLYNLLGNPIYFSGDLELESAMKECYSAVPQSTVAMITRVAYTKMQQFIEDQSLDWDLLQDNHDSLLVQCPENEYMECCKKEKEFLEMDLENFRGEKFKMKSEVVSGFNWAPYHKDKNPFGLQEIKI